VFSLESPQPSPMSDHRSLSESKVVGSRELGRSGSAKKNLSILRRMKRHRSGGTFLVTGIKEASLLKTCLAYFFSLFCLRDERGGSSLAEKSLAKIRT
jgi:hypothetical protein